MPTLYLIDGNSYIYRAFYAIRGLTNSKGFPTNAIYGFTNMLLKIQREKQPDFIAVAFDSPVPTKRHIVYEAYKAQRPKMPDELRQQIPYIKEIVSAFKIPIIELEGLEADDILGSIAKKAESENIETYIVTSDKDTYQLLSPRVKVYDSMRDKVIGEKEISERFGVEPKRIPEVMALMGDAIDNIPGVPGIGEKTAVALLKEFGSLDKIIKDHLKIKQPKLRASVSENIENIKLSLALATLDTTVPLEISVRELTPEEPDWAELLRLFREFEFGRLLKLIPEQRTTEKYLSILDKHSLRDVINNIKAEVVIDTETTGKDPMRASLVGISLSTDGSECYIPVGHFYSGAPEQLQKDYVLKELKAILENPEIKKIGHNIKYDLVVLRMEGVELKGIGFDTMLASYLLNPNKPNHSLEDVALNYLAVKKISFDEVFGKGKKDFSEVSIEDATKYSAEDAAVTAKLKKVLEPSIKEQGLDTLFYELELPLIDVLADMEMAGVKIDMALMAAMSKELERELDGLQRRIYFLAGGEFNINSPKQLQEVLFERMGLRAIKKIKTGYSTDVGVLEELALEHELPREILEHRSLSKLKNTYVDVLPRIINPRTGRLHTSFNQTVTATGRLSSSEPNLQNIPIRGEWGRRIRAAFISESRHLLMSSDYSQIELRLLAHLSQDAGLLDAFRADGDIHTKTASELFGVSPEAVTPEMRRRAKTVNFGIIYGISPYGLSQELGITPQEAKMFIDKYFERHSGVRQYIDTLIRDAKEKGYVETILCRRRAIPELRSPNKTTRQLGERLAVNSPIQGSAADIIKCAMLNIWRRIKMEGLKTKMLLQVHDELLFEVPEDEVDRANALVKEEMEKAAGLSVPLKAELGLGRSWAEAH